MHIKLIDTTFSLINFVNISSIQMLEHTHNFPMHIHARNKVYKREWAKPYSLQLIPSYLNKRALYIYFHRILYLSEIKIFVSFLYHHLYCSHNFLEASNSDSETTQVRKSVIHAKYFHLPIKVLRFHKGLSRSSLSFVIVPD